jgi:hypothetical protein
MNTTPISLSEVIKRVGSETPPFFKKLRIYAWIAGLVIGSATTSVLSAGIALPVWAIVLVTFAASVCGGIATASYLPTSDKQTQEESNRIHSK